MRSKRCTLLLLCVVGCGFESRIEGAWSPVPGSLEAKELVARGVPKPSAKQLVSSTFVAEDGVVYLGAVHDRAALARYVIEREKGDCATVHFEATDPTGKVETSESIEACFEGDDLTLRQTAGGKPLSVTFRRR